MTEVLEGNNIVEPVLLRLCFETREILFLSGRTDVSVIITRGQDEKISNM